MRKRGSVFNHDAKKFDFEVINYRSLMLVQNKKARVERLGSV